MGRGANIGSIQNLEEQIKEHEMAIIKLKRARNSLLDVSALPPEVLGKIFHLNVTVEGDFDGPEERSYNFLLVCHYWFGVATQTPGLWTFWGNNAQDWGRRYLRSNVAIPLDLVLDSVKYPFSGISEYQQAMLKERATRDTIRQIHLRSDMRKTLTPIISPLLSPSGGLQTKSLESLTLRTNDEIPLDVSFLIQSYLPKLQHLELFNCTISSWGHLASQTTLLTTLDLFFDEPSPAPAMRQLLSALVSNPYLRKLRLATRAIPDDNDDDELSRVSLPHLSDLQLDGGVGQVFRLLRRLEFPRETATLELGLSNAQVTDISQTIGPYLQDYLQCRGKLLDGLGLSVSFTRSVTLELGDPWAPNLEPSCLAQMVVFTSINIELDQALGDLVDESVLVLIAYIPRGDIIYLRACGSLKVAKGLQVQLPNLKTLDLRRLPLSAFFPTPDQGQQNVQELLPSSLEHILLEEFFVTGFDWHSLIAYLLRRVAHGNKLNSLLINGRCHVCWSIILELNTLVRKFRITDSCMGWCPFEVC